MSRWKFFVLLVLLLVSFLGVYLLGNGRVHLWDRDEPRYANASRWMARTQDWVVPRWGFGTIDEAREPRTAKPPLIYWAQAASMKTFGDTTFAARFPSSVATITLLGLLGIVLARSVGKRRALWTVFILGSAGMVVASSKMCVTDAVLLLFITTMLLGVAAVRLGHRARWIPAILWLAVALAGLTKGPVVLGVMVTTLLVLACFDRTGKWTSPRAWLDAVRWWRFLRPVMGLIIICVVVGPWLYLVSGRAPGFLTESISHDVINRMRSGLEGHKGPPGFYLLTIWGTYFPWSLLLPASLILAWRHRHLPHVRFALSAVIGPWIMMELVQTKLVHYVLPIFPALAFLTADAIVRFARRQYTDLEKRSWIITTGVWGVIVALVGLLPWTALWVFDRADVPVFGAAVFTGVACVMGLVTFLCYRAKDVRFAALSMGAGFIGLVVVMYTLYLPDAKFLRLPVRISADLKSLGATGEGSRGRVFMIGYREPSVAWYQDGTIAERDSGWLDSLLSQELPRWVVMTRSEWDQFTPPLVQDAYDIKSTERGWNYAGGKVVEVLVLEKRGE